MRQRDLLAKADRFLASAELLHEHADFGSSVSRSYYAMFYAAQAPLESRGVQPSSHGGIISEFGRHFVQTGVVSREIGRDLARALEKRQIGDYDATTGIMKEDSAAMHVQALRFVTIAKRVLAESP